MTHGRHAIQDDPRALDGEPVALHLTLSVLTCGVWALTGWPIAAAITRRRRRRDERPATDRVAVLD